ncbi:cupin domain-containing protein [Thalassotalea sp. PLHSN55]|uniref:cupin domain-containing protein n=1 Tax=Thalassotalea sp. PLHSN55 TaxID=3435888 RepID=UPI003F8324C0
MSKRQVVKLTQTPLAQANKIDTFVEGCHASCFYCAKQNFSIGFFKPIKLAHHNLTKKSQASEVTVSQGDQAFIVLSGSAVIETTSNNKSYQFCSGQGFVLPQGLAYRWLSQSSDFTALHVLMPVVISNNSTANLEMVNAASSEIIDIILFDDTADALAGIALTGDSFVLKQAKQLKQSKQKTQANKGEHLYQNKPNQQDSFIAGLWQGDALETEFQPFPRHEFIYINAGELTCFDQEYGENTYSVGDALFIPKGTLCRWKIPDKVETYYVIIQA